jgi:hypothetical protein
MEENFEKPQIHFNDKYDRNLIDTPYYRVFFSHIKELYPSIFSNLNEASLLESYIEPKITKLLQSQIDFQKKGYPVDGAKELAYRTVFDLIADELLNAEEEEYLEKFDLDKHSFIDTEEI